VVKDPSITGRKLDRTYTLKRTTKLFSPNSLSTILTPPNNSSLKKCEAQIQDLPITGYASPLPSPTAKLPLLPLLTMTGACGIGDVLAFRLAPPLSLA
jgi:hypothetical protein